MSHWKLANKSQHTFFAFADDALKFFSGRFNVSENEHGLLVLKVDAKFVSSFLKEDREDAILFYANRYVNRALNK